MGQNSHSSLLVQVATFASLWKMVDVKGGGLNAFPRSPQICLFGTQKISDVHACPSSHRPWNKPNNKPQDRHNSLGGVMCSVQQQVFQLLFNFGTTRVMQIYEVCRRRALRAEISCGGILIFPVSSLETGAARRQDGKTAHQPTHIIAFSNLCRRHL